MSSREASVITSSTSFVSRLSSGPSSPLEAARNRCRPTSRLSPRRSTSPSVKARRVAWRGTGKVTCPYWPLVATPIGAADIGVNVVTSCRRHEQRRQVAGVGQSDQAAVHVDRAAEHGSELAAGRDVEQARQLGQDDRRGVSLGGVRPDGVVQGGHRRRRLEAMARNITDDEDKPVTRPTAMTSYQSPPTSTRSVPGR